MGSCCWQISILWKPKHHADDRTESIAMQTHTLNRLIIIINQLTTLSSCHSQISPRIRWFHSCRMSCFSQSLYLEQKLSLIKMSVLDANNSYLWPSSWHSFVVRWSTSDHGIEKIFNMIIIFYYILLCYQFLRKFCNHFQPLWTPFSGTNSVRWPCSRRWCYFLEMESDPRSLNLSLISSMLWKCPLSSKFTKSTARVKQTKATSFQLNRLKKWESTGMDWKGLSKLLLGRDFVLWT